MASTRYCKALSYSKCALFRLVHPTDCSKAFGAVEGAVTSSAAVVTAAVVELT
jgi:hypothetical protein